MDSLTLLALVIAVCAAASTGAMYPPGAWYDTIEKPTWTPPNWLFPLAWTALYAGMVWAAWRVAQVEIALAGPSIVAPGLALFAAQITLNAIWTPMFFGLNRIGAALVVVLCLWGVVALMMIVFFRADTLAGFLIVPYLIWVSYASALNAWIWKANRGR